MNMQNSVIFVEESLKIKYANDKTHHKVWDHCHYTGEYRGAAHVIFNLEYNIPKEITLIFHNVPNYDYHFIILELAEEFEGQFTCLGENTEKYMIFSVPKEKEFNRIGKD